MLRSLILLPLLGFLATSPLPATPEGGRTFRVLFPGAPADAPRSVFLFDGKSCREIELPGMNFSPVYELPAGPLVLRLLESAPTSPAEVPVGAPTLKLGDDTGDFYLLVRSDPDNSILPLAMQRIAADQDSFRNGQMLWFNLTDKRIGGKLGKERLDLASNSRQVSKAPAREAESYPVELYYQLPSDKRPWPLCETRWQHNPEGRTVLFVIQESGSRVPRIMGVPDFRAKADE